LSKFIHLLAMFSLLGLLTACGPDDPGSAGANSNASSENPDVSDVSELELPANIREIHIGTLRLNNRGEIIDNPDDYDIFTDNSPVKIGSRVDIQSAGNLISFFGGEIWVDHNFIADLNVSSPQVYEFEGGSFSLDPIDGSDDFILLFDITIGNLFAASLPVYNVEIEDSSNTIDFTNLYIDQGGSRFDDYLQLVRFGPNGETLIGLDDEIRIQGRSIYIDDVLVLKLDQQYYNSLSGEPVVVGPLTIDPENNKVVISYDFSTIDFSVKLKPYTDPDSSLEWIMVKDTTIDSETGSPTTYSIDDNVSYCQSLEIDENSDWRTPNGDEFIGFLTRHMKFADDNLARTPDIVEDSCHPAVSNCANSSNDTLIFPVSGLVVDSFAYIRYYRAFSENTRPITEQEIISKLELSSSQTSPRRSLTRSCVRGKHILAKPVLAGKWFNIATQVSVDLAVDDYVTDIEIVNDQHIRLSTLQYNNGFYLSTLEQSDYILSGIPDVQLKGTFTSFAEASGTASKPAFKNRPSSANRPVSGIAGISVVLGCVNNQDAAHCRRFEINPVTVDTPVHNTVVEAVTEDEIDVIYIEPDSQGVYTLDEASPITIATGETAIEVTDVAENVATFIVEVIGEETDVGVLNIPETDYNFKTSVDHGVDYIYYGYNDGEAAIDYDKNIDICNIGTEDISGTSFTIEVAAEDADLLRSFTHNYDGSAIGFPAGSCRNYSLDFDFFRPVSDENVKINITINDNFNNLSWDDYVSFKLSQYPPLPFYFASNTQTLQGYLTAPGNQLIRVQFSQNSGEFLRVPLKLDDEYHLVLATTSVDGEDTYMISTVDAPDYTRMDGFTDVNRFEPNNNSSEATEIPLLNGEEVSFLASGDLDFYRLVDIPKVLRPVENLFIDDNIVLAVNTRLDPHTVNDGFTVMQNGAVVTGDVTYEPENGRITFDPVDELTAGTIEVTLTSGLQSGSGISAVSNQTWLVAITDYPATMTKINSVLSTTTNIPQFYFNGFINDHLVTHERFGLVIYDDQDKRNFQIIDSNINSHVGSYFSYSYSNSITTSGDYCFFFNEGSSGIEPEVYDCSDSRDLLKIGDYSLSQSNSNRNSYSQIISDELLFVNYQYTTIGNTEYALDIFEFNPDNPVEITLRGSITSELDPLLWGSRRINGINGDRLYIDKSYETLIIDISNIEAPAVIASLSVIDGGSYTVLIPDTDILYNVGYDFTTETYPITIIDVSDANNPVIDSSISDLPLGVINSAISGTTLFTVNQSHEMHVIDISAPTAPVVLDTYLFSESTTIGYNHQLIIRDNFAYIFDQADQELEIVNVQMYQ
jgi:hypothetical protein